MGNVDGLTRQSFEEAPATARRELGVPTMPRTIVQLAAGEFLVALADDGTAWEYRADAREWHALPPLPPRVRGAA